MKKLLLAMSLFVSTPAAAQTVQPVYTRPSKGAALTILNLPAANGTTTYTPSAIFDWSAFAGVIVTMNAPTPAAPNTACKYGVRVKALGGTSTNRSEYFLLNVANSDYRASVSQAWYVRVLPGYLSFNLETYEAVAVGGAACSGNFKVTITPLPIDYSGQLVSTGVESKVQGGFESTSTVNFTSNYPYTRLQCFETNATGCRCAPVKDGVAGTPTILLNPSDSNGHYGGVVEINNWVGTLSCTGAMGIFQH